MEGNLSARQTFPRRRNDHGPHSARYPGSRPALLLNRGTSRSTLLSNHSENSSNLEPRLDSHRLPGSYSSEIGTWRDRVSHGPSHVPCVAGRDWSTRGSATKTHATRACCHHNGLVRQCLGLGQAQSQSTNQPIVRHLLRKPANQHVSIQ